MPRPTSAAVPAPRRPPSRTVAIVSAAVAVVVAGAFALGFASAALRPPAAAARPAPARPEPETSPAPPVGAPLPAPVTWAPPPAADEPAPPPAVPAAPTQELRERVTVQARERLEALRSQVVSRCWPDGGLRSGAKQAKLVMHLTFDREGREIARGISQDRRAPAGEFGACLRGLRDTSVSVTPPGANVGVSIPLTFP